MTAKYYTLLTEVGAAKLANATALGVPLKLTHMAVGDGGGTLPTPSSKQVALVGEKRRAAINSLSIDLQNASQIIAEQVIPESDGGWWVREIGLFDEDGDLIAVGNCPESYKPQLAEGSGRTQTVRMVIITSSTDSITLKIDPSVVLATRGYVDNLIETRQQKSDTLTALAALKPAKGKLPYFTAEKAAALADLSDFIRLMLNKGDAAGVLEYLGLGGVSSGMFPIGMPFYWPSATMPNLLLPEWSGMTFLKLNGSTFSATTYPKLALIIPGLTLPDTRGEFIRNWDDGRGVDSGRALLSSQTDALQNIVASMGASGSFYDASTATFSGAWAQTYRQSKALVTSGGTATFTGWDFDASRVVRTADETRSRNVAFNFIVRAA